MPNCEYCGSELRAGLKFCAICGAPVAEALKREAVDWKSSCPFCGAKISGEEGVCGECGKTLPADYESYVEQVAKAKRFRRKHGGLHLLWALLPLVLLFIFNYVDNWLWDAVDSEQLSEAWRRAMYYYEYEIHLIPAIGVVLLAALVAVPVVWGIRRKRAFKQLNITRTGYRRLLKESVHIPEGDIRRVSQKLWPQRRQAVKEKSTFIHH